jgi:SRSO17 transposase
MPNFASPAKPQRPIWPMTISTAVVTQPGRVQATHQLLHPIVAKADRSDEAVLAAVRTRVVPIIEQRGPIQALVIDDTGMPKKGKHSVGVARLSLSPAAPHR